MDALDSEEREALARDLDWALHAHVDDDDGVVFPIQAWLVTGTGQRRRTGIEPA